MKTAVSVYVTGHNKFFGYLRCICTVSVEVFLHFHFASFSKAGWPGGAMVLSKLPVPGRLTNLDKSWARAFCACSRCGWGLFGHFFISSIISLFILPLSGRRPDID